MLTLDEQLAGIAEKLGQLDSNNRGDLAELSRLTTLQNELLAQQALEERVQVQEIKVASITLPEGYDFNELWGDENANSIIIELLKDFQRQSDADHNGDINEMIIAHRDELRAANDRELQLKRQNEELQEVADDLNSLIKKERADYEAQIESLKETIAEEAEANHITFDRLKETQRELANALLKVGELEDTLKSLEAKAAINVTRIETTDRLASLVEASKQAKVKSALDIALENTTPFRGKVLSEGVANLDAPQVTPFPVINQAGNSGNQLVTGPAFSVPTDNQEVTPSQTEVSTVSVGLVEGIPSEVRESSKTIEERVAELEKAVFGA